MALVRGVVVFGGDCDCVVVVVDIDVAVVVVLIIVVVVEKDIAEGEEEGGRDSVDEIVSNIFGRDFERRGDGPFLLLSHISRGVMVDIAVCVTGNLGLGL